ncbi:MAG: hypothetical protein LYZ69_01025 [Nitrososphaerales archaeon]|nr:hypothetical protein [Nitrososphaerales archaeon]
MSIPAYDVVVDYVSEGDVANLVRGYVQIKGKKVRFTGVAYGRFGGQNFSPQLSPSAKKTIKQLTGDVDKFEEDLQLKLVKGEFEAKPPKDEKHAHTHLGAS